MRFWGAFQQSRSNAQMARLLASICIFLYLLIFSVLFFIASSHGASPEKMIGLELGENADTIEFVHLTHNILDARRFALDPHGPAEFARVPGYPAFLALTLLVFHTLLVVPLIQIGFTAYTVALIYLVGVRHFSRSIALAAATIYMIDPVVIYAAWIPITESMFMLLFIGSLYTMGTSSKWNLAPYLLAGALFGLAIYTRPIALYATPIFACFAFAYATTWRIAIRNALICVFATLCVLSPWMMRNYYQSGHFAFSSNGAWQFYAVNMATFEQVRTGISYHEILKKNNSQFGTNDEHVLRSFEYADSLNAITKDVLLSHPWQYLAFHFYKSIAFFFSSSIVNSIYHMHQFGILLGDGPQGEGAWGMISQHRWHDALEQTFTHIPRLLERIFLGLALCAAVYATIVSLYRKDARTPWITCAFVLLFAFAVFTGPGSDETRYRIPSEPFVFLLAAYGAQILWERFKIPSAFSRQKNSTRSS